MRCPYCRSTSNRVIDSRTLDENTSIRRRRLCETCGKRFTTYERVDTVPMIVIKQSGAREPFDRIKLQSGVMKSCNKRPVSVTQIESLVDDIESAIQNTMEKEISTRRIGDMVMERLREIDEVSYIRFASVYKQFKDIDTFYNELASLLADRNRKD